MVAALIVSMLAASCSLEAPLVRENPYVPDSIYSISLAGPDSLHSMGDVLIVTLNAEPELPGGDYRLEWEAFPWMEPNGLGEPIPRRIFVAGDPGEFSVFATSARYKRVSVAAYFDRVAVGHQVWVGQKPAAMTLSCSASVPVPCDAPRQFGSVVAVHPLMTDARGNALMEPEWAVMRASVTSRDPAVVVYAPVPTDSSAFVRLVGRGAGTTWVVIDIDGEIDSVSLTFAPPSP